MNKRKFTTRFATTIDLVSLKSLQDREVVGSLKDLIAYIPKNIIVDGNDDLLYVAFNGTVVNQFNLNGDGISVETAANILPRFAQKQINLQHNRADIIGHTLNAGFSTYENSDLLTVEDALKIKDPVNLSITGTIYKVVNPKLIHILQSASDENNEIYNTVSASWEIAFSEYYIALGDRNLKNAEIITNEAKILEYTPFLLGEKEYEWSETGTGTLPDGTPVYRLIVGNDVLPTGFGLTTQPAADVKGIYTVEDEIELDDEEEFAEKTIKNKKIKNKCSTKSQVTVNQFEIEPDKNMTPEEIQKIIQDAIAAAFPKDNKTTEVVATVIDSVKEALKEANTVYTSEIEKERGAKEAAVAAQTAAETQLADTQAKLEAISAKVEAFEKATQDREVSEAFNARMEKLETEYDLNDADRKTIAAQIRGLDSEAFDGWFANFAQFAEAKSKTFIANRKKEIEDAVAEAKKTVVASTEPKTTEDVLDEVKTTEAAVPNAVKTEAPSLVDRIQADLAKHITIS